MWNTHINDSRIIVSVRLAKKIIESYYPLLNNHLLSFKTPKICTA